MSKIITLDGLRDYLTNLKRLFVTKTDAESTYETKANAANIYETKEDAATHLSKSDAAGTYLSKTDAASTCVQTTAIDQTIAGTKTFSKPIVGSVTGSSGSCTGNAASANIATKADSATKAANADHATSADSATNATYANWLRTSSHPDYLFLAEWDGAFFWAHVNDPTGSYVAVRVARSDSSGNADTATKLATARTIALSGAATGKATGFDGSGNITIPVTSLDASKLTGTASVSTTGNAASANIATKATQDAAGNTITTTYATKAENNIKANNSEVVHKSGDETIAGTKTFSKPIVGSVTGSSGSCTGNAATATQFSANATVALTGDATGTSAGSKKGWSVPVTLANSGVTAGTYGPSADVTGNNNATISVPEITVDAKGRVTSVTNRTLTCKNNTYNVYNKTLTIQKNGTNVATFTSNSNTNVTANITVPTKVSELTNDSGFLTSHQSLSNYVTLNGAQTISGAKTFNSPINSPVTTGTWINGNRGVAIINSTANAGYNVLFRMKSSHGVFTGCAYDQSYQINYTTDSIVNAGTNATTYTNTLIDENGNATFSNNITVRGTVNGNLNGNVTGNANTATNATNSNAANQLQAFVNDNFTGGNHYVKAIRSSQGWSTHLWMCYNNGAKMADEVSVNYANSAGSANTANSATTATTATKATQDAAGNTITTTYATKAENNIKANNSEVVHKSGDETIAGTKTFSNGVLSTNPNALMAQTGGYTLVLRNDGSNTYILMSDKGGVPGTWSDARPLVINNSTGVCSINGNADSATRATNADHATYAQRSANNAGFFISNYYVTVG